MREGEMEKWETKKATLLRAWLDMEGKEISYFWERTARTGNPS